MTPVAFAIKTWHNVASTTMTIARPLEILAYIMLLPSGFPQRTSPEIRPSLSYIHTILDTSPDPEA
jgi:hypothetical protein